MRVRSIRLLIVDAIPAQLARREAWSIRFDLDSEGLVMMDHAVCGEDDDLQMGT